MKKKLLFSMAAVSILAMGFIIWSCGDDGKKDEVKPLNIELTADQVTINADDSHAGNTIAITAKVTWGSSVDFEITEKPTGSTASVGPATSVAVINGEATTELSAGTVDGNVVVKATVEGMSDEVAVTVTAGALAGIAAVGVTEKYVCGDSLGLIVQLVDRFRNGISGKEVTFTVESGTVTLDPTKTVADANGRATTSVDTTDLGVDESATVTATLTETGNTVDFTLTKIDFLEEPAFHLNTLIIDGDTTNNELGKLAFFINPALDLQDVNQIFVLKDLTEENWDGGPTTVIWAALSGLCGAPDGPPTTSCTGAETEFFIDPISYDSVTGEVQTWADGNITEGNLSVISSGLTLSIPFFDIILDIPLCDLNIAGIVDAQLTEIAGSTIEGTYCPDGCGTIAGAITEADFCKIHGKFVWALVVPWGSCQGIIDWYGLTTDTDCAGEPAFSWRMLYTGTSVTLYEVP